MLQLTLSVGLMSSSLPDIVNMLSFSTKDITKFSATKLLNYKKGTVSGLFRAALAVLLKDMATVQQSGSIDSLLC